MLRKLMEHITGRGYSEKKGKTGTDRLRKDTADSERELRSYFQRAIPDKTRNRSASVVAIIDPAGDTYQAIRVVLDSLNHPEYRIIHIADPEQAIAALQDIPVADLKAVLVQQKAVDMYEDRIERCVLSQLYEWCPEAPLYVQGQCINPERVRVAAGNRFCVLPDVDTSEFRSILTKAFQGDTPNVPAHS